jgi:hypothetical protein
MTMSMNIAPILACFALGACATVSPQTTQDCPCPNCPHDAGERVHRLSLFVAQRSLDEQDYQPVERQPTLGIEYANESREDRFGWEVALFASRDEDDSAGVEYTGSTREASFGIRKSFGTRKARPYVGGGLAYVDAKVDPSGAASDSDGSFAGYFHFGFDVPVTPSFLLGLDIRVLHGSELEIAGLDTDADYAQVALKIGFSF